jgi:hypothetical protein
VVSTPSGDPHMAVAVAAPAAPAAPAAAASAPVSKRQSKREKKRAQAAAQAPMDEDLAFALGALSTGAQAERRDGNHNDSTGLLNVVNAALSPTSSSRK